jgi:hypothetical protein
MLAIDANSKIARRRGAEPGVGQISNEAQCCESHIITQTRSRDPSG